MEVDASDLRNGTGQVIDAARAGERVLLAVEGEPVAVIVRHEGRSPWVSGAWLAEQLSRRAADPGLTDELRDLLP
jgi:prevent-host-death family protein